MLHIVLRPTNCALYFSSLNTAAEAGDIDVVSMLIAHERMVDHRNHRTSMIMFVGFLLLAVVAPDEGDTHPPNRRRTLRDCARRSAVGGSLGRGAVKGRQGRYVIAREFCRQGETFI